MTTARIRHDTAGADRPLVVLTGISGNLGRQVARALHRHYRVIGLDPRPAHNLPKDIAHFKLDYRRRRAEDLFRKKGVFALVHLGVMHHLRMSHAESYAVNITGTQRLFEFCRAYGVAKIVVLSSADAYGPMPGASQFITEDTPLQGDLRYPEMNALVSLDRLTQSFLWMEPAIETVILRPVHIVGPHLRNGASTFLRLPYLPVILGYNPMISAIHQDDLLAAIELALRPGARGVFNLAGTEAAPLSRILQRLERPRIPLPAPLVRAVIERLWRHNLLTFPPPELDHLQYNMVLDTSRAKESLGFSPRFGWPELIAQFKDLHLHRA